MKKSSTYSFALVILMLFLNSIKFSAQNKYTGITKYGGGLETYISCNGHGAFYSPYLSVYKGNSAFNFGPTIQKRSGIMNGFKVLLSHNLTGSKNRHIKDEYFYNYHYPKFFQLNFYFSAQYNGNLPLSYATVKKEEVVQREPQQNWNKLKLSTVEVSSGLAFQVNITNNFSWRTNIGLSLYHHLNYMEGMKLEETAPAVNLGTSLSFILN
jgi:hypothetical protein